MIDPKLRKATFDDNARLLEWHNDPVALAVSRTKVMATKLAHERWLRSVLDDPTCHLFICDDDVKSEAWQAIDIQPVGMGRLQTIQNGVAELSYCVAPAYRDDGYGYEIVELLIDQARALGICQIQADVHTHNYASLKILLGRNFVIPDPQFLLMVKELT